MKWKELRGIYFPLCMEEISKVKKKYLGLISQMQKQNSEKDRKNFLELKKSIEQRVIDIDNFIDENFDKQFVLHFEKCKIKLKNLLQINPKEKLSKQNLNKNFHDVDCFNKLLKKQQEKEKESQKLKMKDEPIYNQLPVDYGLYEGIIEEMKLKELKNKIYLNPNTKYLGDISNSDENQSQEDSLSISSSNNNDNNNNEINTNSSKNKNYRLTFGNTSKNFFINNSSSLKNTKSSKSKSLQVINEQ